MSMVGVAMPVRAPSSRTAPVSASVSKGRPSVRSCSMDVRCAPTAAAPSMRLSMFKAKRAPRASPTACASAISAAAMARVPGSVAITSKVAWVSAESGLNAKLPHSFIQMSLRRCGRIGARKPAPSSSAAKATVRSLRSPFGSPRIRRLSERCRTKPGRTTSTDG